MAQRYFHRGKKNVTAWRIPSLHSCNVTLLCVFCKLFRVSSFSKKIHQKDTYLWTWYVKSLRYLVQISRSRGVISQGSYGSLPQDGGLTKGLARPSPLAFATKLQASFSDLSKLWAEYGKESKGLSIPNFSLKSRKWRVRSVSVSRCSFSKSHWWSKMRESPCK